MVQTLGKYYMELLAGTNSAQQALLACSAALRLDDETAMEAIELAVGANADINELLHAIKNLGCVRNQWDGSWYIADKVRKELLEELYLRLPEDMIFKIRNHLAYKAKNRTRALAEDGQITEYRIRLSTIEAGYQLALLPEEARESGKLLEQLWERSTFSGNNAIANTIDYLATEIAQHIGGLPLQMLFLRGIAARSRGNKVEQKKYFYKVWRHGSYGEMFALAAHFFGTLERDQTLAESALRDSIRWDLKRAHQAHAYHSLGNLLAKNRYRLKEAEKAYHYSLEVDADPSGRAQVYHSLGNLLAKDQRIEEAEEAYRYSLQLCADSSGRPQLHHLAQVYHSLGNLLAKNQRWEEAEEVYRHSVELFDDPYDKAKVFASVAHHLCMYRNTEADNIALRFALASLILSPNNSRTNGVCFHSLADIYERQHDYARAIAALQSHLETNQKQGNAKFNPAIQKRISKLKLASLKKSDYT